jgi:uncharacterized membrane protein YbaN (DUF454 family)
LWVRVANVACGVACIVIGIAGVLLPLLPGTPFLVVAYLLLVPEFPWLGKPVVLALRRWPKLRRKLPPSLRRRPRARPPAR